MTLQADSVALARKAAGHFGFFQLVLIGAESETYCHDVQ